MKLMNADASAVYQTLSNFQFSAVEMDRLGASEYTLVQLVVDASSSVAGYRGAMEACMNSILESCQRSPRSENLLLRVIRFSSAIAGRTDEIHGFTPLAALKLRDYKGTLRPGGATPLCDGALNAVESLAAFGKRLYDQDYLVNAACFVVTDGMENASQQGDAAAINRAIVELRRSEILESLQTVLIGVNDRQFARELDAFRNAAGFDEYISLGAADAKRLAQLAQWVSQSIQAASQALGSGGPSRRIGFQF